MRVPLLLIGDEKVPLLEDLLSSRFRIVGKGDRRELVLTRNEWNRLLAFTEQGYGPLNEAASVVLRAYNQLIRVAPQARSTPAGKAAVIAAVMGIYTADPSLGSRLTFLLTS